MALFKFLLALIFFSSLEVFSLSQRTPSSEHRLDIQALLSQICSNVESHSTCISNIQNELNKMGRPPHDGNSVISAAIKATLDEAKLAIEMISKFTVLSVSYREQIAIEDCKELLDFSVTELAWSLGEMEKIRAGSHDYRYGGNLKAWLSAALSNQDTCLEGFEGTDGHLQSFIKGSLKQVTQLIGNVLTLYSRLHSLPFRPPRSNATSDTVPRFPSWMSEGDQQLLTSNPLDMHVDAIVTSDSSGHYRTITQAINEAPDYSNQRYVIYVKRGVYVENIDLKKKKTNIMLVGDGIGATIVTGNRNFPRGWTTFRTATVAVSGKGFVARDMTFRNTAGPENYQAVALRVDSDQSAFYRCSMEGYQDTLYAHSLRHFYRECHIYGTIDFIFGNGAAILQNCYIHTRVPLPFQKVTITAQGRRSPDQSTGFVIQNSQILATQPTYLGRPWKQYSRTVYLNTYMSRMVQPRGWLEWLGGFALNTLWYGEYMNYGPGAGISGRVQWPGYHVIKDLGMADYFTVRRFIDGMAWLPSTGVKFTAGLSN